MQKAILEQHGYGWAIWLYGVPNMPEDVELPLPYNVDVPLHRVTELMSKRFPQATFLFRTARGVIVETR